MDHSGYLTHLAVIMASLLLSKYIIISDQIRARVSDKPYPRRGNPPKATTKTITQPQAPTPPPHQLARSSFSAATTDWPDWPDTQHK